MPLFRLLPVLLAWGFGCVGSGEKSAAVDHPPDTEADDDTDGPETPDPLTRFAVIGDYGTGTPPELAVANLVNSWDAQFIITLGDNNYPSGAHETIDANIGAFYHDWIHPYTGQYGAGPEENRFFPSPGNHDWNTGSLQAYLDYFELPGNERYYSFVRGPVEFFAVDSDYHEPDGNTSDSIQADWLQAALSDSTATFKVVYMHHAPYSSGNHGDAVTMQWPYFDWGADVVLAGHEHSYERLLVDGDLYIVNGTGGAGLREFPNQASGSQLGFKGSWGAQYAVASETSLQMQFYDIEGSLIDDVTLFPGASLGPSGTALVNEGATWSYSDNGGASAPGWNSTSFADNWSQGPSPLGYGADVATEISDGGDPDNKHLVSWFRHTFTVDDASGFDSLLLQLARDDAAIVYLNGNEVWRLNLPPGEVDHTTAAASNIEWWFQTALIPTMLSTENLLDGENVLAVQVHQHDAASSDMYFNLVLHGR